MALLLREEDVRELITMEEAISCVEEAFRQHGLGAAVNRPRSRITLPGGTFHLMSAALPEAKVLGFKAYTSYRGATRFVVLLYDSESGELLALMEADWLGRMRTGAASAVATKYLARLDAGQVGILGTGAQARTQLVGVCSVRNVNRVVAYGRNPERRRSFAREMSEVLHAEVLAAESPEEAAENAEILITATTAREPLFDGACIQEGTHVNAVGSNWAQRRELDEVALHRSSVIVVDSKEQAFLESGDLIPAVRGGLVTWDQVHELGEVVVGRNPGRRSPRDITLFESHGVALEDVAAAAAVYQAARERGRGEELRILEFGRRNSERG